MAKVFLCMIAASITLAFGGASAQILDLSGEYRCVQGCRGDRPAAVAQIGRELNLVNEAGELSRAWIERPGRIWARNFDEGAIYSPDGLVIQFDRGTVWQRDLVEVEPAPAPRVRAQRPVPPDARVVARSEPPTPPAPRAGTPAARAGSSAARAALPRDAFDGSWSVVINTQSGACDPQYRFGVQIINGNIVYEGGGAANAQGQVSPNGSVWVSVASAGQQASGQGRLSGDFGTGTWRGQGSAGSCAGVWQAARRS
jgi:hypothetical protein